MDKEESRRKALRDTEKDLGAFIYTVDLRLGTVLPKTTAASFRGSRKRGEWRVAGGWRLQWSGRRLSAGRLDRREIFAASLPSFCSLGHSHLRLRAFGRGGSVSHCLRWDHFEKGFRNA